MAVLAASALQAFAQGYPGKPVHVVITFPPGTATDIVGRVVAQKLSEFWGQPVVSENRGGAGGSIGSAIVAKAAPDGYTLLVDSSAHAVNPAIYAKLPYDTLKDFVDIAPFAGQPNVLVVAPGSPVKSVADLIAEAKAKPGAINFASAGVGTRHAPQSGEIQAGDRHQRHPHSLQGHAGRAHRPPRRARRLLLRADLGGDIGRAQRQAAARSR